MIDIESKVVDAIQTAYEDAGLTVGVSSTFVEAPEKFPWVYVAELSNSTYTNSQDTSLKEHHARVRYRIEVYSNLSAGAKAEAKRLRDIADDAMQSMKFTRTSSSFIPNFDRSVTRLYADYTAIVEEGREDGETITHQMYRG